MLRSRYDMTRTFVAFMTAGLLLVQGGCKSPGASAVKEDFVAAGSREYWVSGTDIITLEPEYATKPETSRLDRAHLLAANRRIAVAWFLNAYLADKEVGDPNFDWGKFNAQVRFGNDTDQTEVRKVAAQTYAFDFKFGVVGYNDLMNRIIDDRHLAPGTRNFSIPMPILDNQLMAKLITHHEWFRDDPWEFWGPKATPANEQRQVAMHLEPQPVDSDAYLPIDRLVADGHLSIAVHFGWDGENSGRRNDIVLSEVMFQKLIQMGFQAPTRSFASYEPFKATTPPFKKSIKVNGKEIAVEVSVYFGGQHADGIEVAGPDITTDAGGKIVGAEMRHSLSTKRVIIYIGHSGVRRGFNLADWNRTAEGNIPPLDLETLPLLNSFQLVVAEGCQTYYLADAFWQNPSKRDRRNLNLITSNGFTASASITTATRLIKALTQQSVASGKPQMVSPRVSSILAALNRDYKIPFPKKSSAASLSLTEGDADDPLFPVYGLHGVQENPKADPLANTKSLCQPCTNKESCGGDGNLCSPINGASAFCTMGCTDDKGCVAAGGPGYRCHAPSDPGGAGVCVPVAPACKSGA
ncbi:MAG: hypothetical protein NTZ90_01805 [Proteobacteria bacterium]|nr:hypothetical protein [Pseudomonadota bacterium]